MQHPPTAITYRPDIDGLRALAVTIVVLFHAGFGFTGGFVGVDIFFVISGYLITSLLLKDLDAGTFSIVRFYERRVRRILPASVVTTLAVLAVGWFWLLPSDFDTLGRSAVAHAVCVANVFFARQAADYFAGAAEQMPLLHMWSLAVEEQFYLLFPLLLMACYRTAALRGRRAMLGVIGVVGLISFVLSVRGTAADVNRTFYLLPTRAWELLVGCALAAMPGWSASRGVRDIAAWAGLAAMLGPAWWYSGETPFPGLAAVPPCAGAALVIASGRAGGGAAATTVARMLSTPAVVFVGAISYSLYLAHWPLLAFARYWAVGPLPVSTRLILVATAFAAAVVSWWAVERPFRVRRACASRRSIFVAGLGGVVVVLSVGLWVDSRNGLPVRFAKRVAELDKLRGEGRHLAQHTAADVQADRLTPLGVADANVPPTLLLWGDSHAGATRRAFDAFCTARGIKGRAATHSATTPLLDYAIGMASDERDKTLAFGRAVVDYVARHRIATVFLVNYWERDIHHDPTMLAEALERTIDALNRAGATVYVVGQTPAYAIEVPKALAYEAMHDRPLAGWRKTLAGHRQAQAVMGELAMRLESPACRFIDPAPFFARKGDAFLATTDRGRPLYNDAHHLNAYGALKVFRPFLDASVPTATTRPGDAR